MEFRDQIVMRFSNQAKEVDTLTWKHPLTVARNDLQSCRLIERSATLRNYDFGQIVFAILSLPNVGGKQIVNNLKRDWAGRTKFVREFKGRGNYFEECLLFVFVVNLLL